MNKLLPLMALSALLVSGCGSNSESDSDEASSSGIASSQNQKMLDNCDTLEVVTSPFAEAYAKGNYVAATEALTVRAGSLATVSQTVEESDLINAITMQIPTVKMLIQSGQYADQTVMDFLVAGAKYSAFCFNLAFAE
jgi:hypothetical protein